MGINFVDLKKQYGEELGFTSFMRIRDLIMSGQFVGGLPLERFEKNFANYHGVDNCVGVGSGTDALILALKSLGIGPGDEVIVPANTFIATAFAASQVGATPVFVDVDPALYNLTLDTILPAVTEDTRAIIAVHLYGNPVDILPIVAFCNENDIFLIEDCAQATGGELFDQKIGTFGHAGCFSFYPTKNLGGLGQGGAVITNEKHIADKIRSYGNVGRKEGSWFDYDLVGYNSRLDTINAAFLNEGLKHLDGWNARRIEVAERYYNQLPEGVPFPEPRGKHVYHLFEYKCESKEERDALMSFLKDGNVGVGLHYPVPCHKQSVYADLGYELPVSEKLADTLLSLPMSPVLTNGEVDIVCGKINEFMENTKNGLIMY